MRRSVDPATHPRAQRDAALSMQIERVWHKDKPLYGEVWKQVGSGYHSPAYCTVERLMRRLGLRAAIRSKEVKTTASDKAALCPTIATGSFGRAAECAVGKRLHLRLHLGGFRLRGLRHPCVRAADRGLKGVDLAPTSCLVRCSMPVRPAADE